MILFSQKLKPFGKIGAKQNTWKIEARENTLREHFYALPPNNFLSKVCRIISSTCKLQKKLSNVLMNFFSIFCQARVLNSWQRQKHLGYSTLPNFMPMSSLLYINIRFSFFLSQLWMRHILSIKSSSKCLSDPKRKGWKDVLLSVYVE